LCFIFKEKKCKVDIVEMYKIINLKVDSDEV
jgi:hypothetical protein